MCLKPWKNKQRNPGVTHTGVAVWDAIFAGLVPECCSGLAVLSTATIHVFHYCGNFLMLWHRMGPDDS